MLTTSEALRICPLKQSAAQRFEELDSLRGLAALTVVFSHFEFAFGPRTMANGERFIPTSFIVWEISPLHLFVAGHESVLLFFLLSGFVLALPHFTGSGPALSSFYLKRFFRLYVPYFIALALACFANLFFYGHVSGMSDWTQRTWSAPPDQKTIFQHVLMLGDFSFSRYNTAFWSLVYEARISCIYPVIVLLAKRTSAAMAILAALCMSVGGQVLLSQSSSQQIATTMHYGAIFILGAVGAKYRLEISQWFRRLQKEKQNYFLVCSLLLIAVSAIVKHAPGILHRLMLITDWPPLIASIMLLVSAQNHPTMQRFLIRKPFLFLGRISYSLYLVHATILFVYIHLLAKHVSVLFLLLIYFVTAVSVASIFHWLVEIPSTLLGRHFGRSHAPIMARLTLWKRFGSE